MAGLHPLYGLGLIGAAAAVGTGAALFCTAGAKIPATKKKGGATAEGPAPATAGRRAAGESEPAAVARTRRAARIPIERRAVSAAFLRWFTDDAPFGPTNGRDAAVAEAEALRDEALRSLRAGAGAGAGAAGAEGDSEEIAVVKRAHAGLVAAAGVSTGSVAAHIIR